MGSLANSSDSAVFDCSKLFSHRVLQYEGGPIRSLLPLEAIPGMLSLVAGKPNPATFPFKEVSITLRGSAEKLTIRGESLDAALQYSLPAGIGDLVRWFEGLQRLVHGIKESDGTSCCIGNGSQELIHRAFHVFTDPGDTVLIETPAYPGVAAFLRAEGQHLVGVHSDGDGLDPAHLENVLANWSSDKPMPKVLYTVPTGSNPTGNSCSEQRKIQILRLAKAFNFIIFEDDAYYFLNFDEKASAARSFLSLERDVTGETGRVLRFDSLSKIVSSGMRLGVLSGPAAAVQMVVKITENINLQPSSTVQYFALTLLRHWGYDGFMIHCAQTAVFYRQRRDAFAAAAEKHLGGKAVWEVPSAGMFFWLTLRLPVGVDTYTLLRTKGMERLILAIPGMAFMPDKRKTCQLRLSFSLIAEEKMGEACRRIARIVDDAWKDEYLRIKPGAWRAFKPVTYCSA